MLKRPDVFGINTKKVREAAGLSIDDLAICVSVPGEVIVMIESGAKRPAGTLMLKIAQALGVSLQSLLLDGIDRDFCPITPKPWNGLEVCQFCDRSYHPMQRWTLGSTKIFVCGAQECKDQAWQAGFEPRPDLTPKR